MQKLIHYPLIYIHIFSFPLIFQSCSSTPSPEVVERFSVVSFEKSCEKEEIIIDLTLDQKKIENIKSYFQCAYYCTYVKDECSIEPSQKENIYHQCVIATNIRTNYALVGYSNNNKKVILNYFWMKDPFVLYVNFDTFQREYNMEKFFTKKEKQLLKEKIPTWKNPEHFEKNIYDYIKVP